MHLRVLSDLHNEFGVLEVRDCDCDAVVLAGDIDLGAKGALWALERFRDKPILYITGNHEYYSHKIPEVHEKLERIASKGTLVFLNNGEHVLGGVRFIGCTLWSDFQFLGREKVKFAVIEAQHVMNDYRKIRMGAREHYRKMVPADSMRLHAESVRYLESRLKKPFDGPTVVITHHLPTPRSLYEEEQDEYIRAAYCSDMEDMILKYRPDIWIHGHRHLVQDYLLGDTRIICNPRGYAGIKEAEGFDPDLVIEV
ncbi:metallophosphoesterase family protein [bacterium]|nr:metallophosphoesterase family protein [bacterium]